MASINKNYSGFQNTFGPLSVDYAEKVFSDDLERAKKDPSLVNYKIENMGSKKVFEAKFCDGMNYWSITETLNYSDNNTYARF